MGSFVKWAGGKRRLALRICDKLPECITTYYEPFVGGGAVFFELARTSRFQRAMISDTNQELINAYIMVRDRLPFLIEKLGALKNSFSREEYEAIRALDPNCLDPVGKAARFLYLNRTCFNGLYRVNQRGVFNSPYGKYKNPTILDVGKLEKASSLLQGVTVKCEDFSDAVEGCKEGDAIYFDPPYLPVSVTASFTSYQKEPFGPLQHSQLLRVFERCRDRGVCVLLSSSYCDLALRLYRNLRVETVQVSRVINSVGSKRGPIKELLVIGGE